MKVHFTKPETLYEHPDTGAKLPFRVGERYWVPWVKRGKFEGQYIERDPTGKDSVVDAYKNPAEYGLQMSPMQKFLKLYPKIYYGVGGFVEEWFHRFKEKSEKDGNEYWTKQVCNGHGCDHCKKQYPKVFGSKVYFEIAKMHWNQSVFGWEERINSSCKCGEDSFIYTPHYECKQCQSLVVDVMNNCFSCDGENIALAPDEAKAECNDCHASWSVYESDNEELSKAVNQEVKCGDCGHKDYPVPKFVCTNCDSPEPFGIFDCQMKIHMTVDDEGKPKEMVIEDVMIQEPDERLFDKRYQDTKDSKDSEEWSEKIADANKKPFDLNKLLAAKSPEEQAQIIGVANPFNTGAASQGYQSYSRHKGNGEEEGESAENEDGGNDEPGEESRVKRAPKGRRIGRVGVRK